MDKITFLATLFLGMFLGLLVCNLIDIIDYFTNKINKRKESNK